MHRLQAVRNVFADRRKVVERCPATPVVALGAFPPRFCFEAGRAGRRLAPPGTPGQRDIVSRKSRFTSSRRRDSSTKAKCAWSEIFAACCTAIKDFSTECATCWSNDLGTVTIGSACTTELDDAEDVAMCSSTFFFNSSASWVSFANFGPSAPAMALARLLPDAASRVGALFGGGAVGGDALFAGGATDGFFDVVLCGFTGGADEAADCDAIFTGGAADGDGANTNGGVFGCAAPAGIASSNHASGTCSSMTTHLPWTVISSSASSAWCQCSDELVMCCIIFWMLSSADSNDWHCLTLAQLCFVHSSEKQHSLMNHRVRVAIGDGQGRLARLAPPAPGKKNDALARRKRACEHTGSLAANRPKAKHNESQRAMSE